jgi:hypothetical protein
MKHIKLALIALALCAAFSSCLVVREPYHHHYYSGY